jgi:hypothetical protein
MKRSGVLLVVALLLAGCTSTVSGSPTPPAAGSALAAALSRIPASTLGSDGYFEFGDSARLRQLAGTDAAIWKFQQNAGASGLSTYAAYTAETIGVDLSAASSALTVNQPPRTMVVLAGGQDRSKITAAATKSGWTGGEVLSRKLDISKGSSAVVGISLVAPKIRPVGSDVVLARTGADPTEVAASGTVAASSADQLPGMKAAILCLGDVPTASGADLTSTAAGEWTAVGAGGGTGGTASSVICLGATDAAAANSLAATVRSALETGRSKRSRQPWSQLLKSATVDVLPGAPTMVRISAGTATAGLGLQLMEARDVPGR